MVDVVCSIYVFVHCFGVIVTSDQVIGSVMIYIMAASLLPLFVVYSPCLSDPHVSPSPVCVLCAWAWLLSPAGSDRRISSH